jgi:iron-sulfur cluster repair protein YtfE (RIC family)
MKRDKNLHPLSWERHHGLVIAKRLQTGLEKQANPEVMSDYTLTMWEEHLHPHFQREEAYLIPVMEKYADSENARLINRLRSEHAEIRELIQHIQANPVDSSLLGSFAERLVAHIRFEERQLFPYAEEIIPQSEMEAMGKQLHDRYAERCMDWKPEFWE